MKLLVLCFSMLRQWLLKGIHLKLNISIEVE